MSLKRGYRNVYDLNIHLVLVTKYRARVINQEMLSRLKEIFEQTCQKWNCTLVEFNGEVDRVHLLIEFPPDVALSKLVNNLKTVSSRLIRKQFPERVAQFFQKPVFWTGTYFIASTGGVTLEQIKQYVEQQNSPAQSVGVEPTD
ncbi:IS200/IS605 family transposase [Synechococcus sp. PCC 7336]|uniref:IS200/IS605 family transposase n=1 Tax=Synechococcus sp. PCC 7336 TaxID=195250 RepID=UPI000365D56B